MQNLINSKKLNNRGNTLVMVIVAMLFIAIIASVVLSLVVKNLDTAKLTNKGTRNFYSAENVMEELRSSLDEYADRAVRTAYETWLSRYTDAATVTTQKATFTKAFAEELKKLLDGDGTSSGEFRNAIASIDDFFVNYDYQNVDVSVGTISVVEGSDNEWYVVLKDVVVGYTDSEGLTTTISTDLRYSVKYPGFSATNATGVNSSVSQYVCIADQTITNDNKATMTLTLNGSLYGGGYKPYSAITSADSARTFAGEYTADGFAFGGEDTSILIRGSNVLTRSNILLMNRVNVDAKGYLSSIGAETTCDIWATNIVFNGLSSTAKPTKLSVTGNCYLADDLTLDSEGANFYIKGAYYGYNVSNASSHQTDAYDPSIMLTSGTPDGSSAVILNKKDAVVNFTDASTIWIAGKCFVSIPKTYTGKDNTSYLQGESVSYKGVQSAYLLPGECITTVGHNPMTEREYEEKVKAATGSVIDLSQSRKRSEGGVRLEDYVNPVSPYRVAYVTYPETNNTIVYLYLNFVTSNKATEYFQSYSAVFHELLENKMSMLNNGMILLPASVLTNTDSILYNTGNVVGYDSYQNISIISGRYSTTSPIIRNKQLELATKYSGLCTSLKASFSGSMADGFLTDSIVDFSKLTVEKSTPQTDTTVLIPNAAHDGSDLTYHLITGYDVTITNSNYSNGAIIIALGDVMIKNGATFKGLILARGNIIIDGNSALTADPTHVNYLIQNDDDVKLYFNSGLGTSGDGKNIYASDLINVDYQNWRKN